MKKATRRAALDVLARVQDSLPPGTLVDPLEILLRVGADQDIPWDLRLDAAKAARKAIYPDLATTQVTGADGQNLRADAMIAVIMADPAKLRAAETLSLELTRETKAVEAAPEV